MPIRAPFSFLAALLLLQGCSHDQWHPNPAEKPLTTLKIEVFGSTSGNDQNYSSIFKGAELAEKTSEVQDMEKSVQVIYEKDAESTTQALSIARRIRDDPDVLAVVGHSYSGTTRAVLPLYADAGIPVIVPAATSPYVTYKFDEHGPWPSLAELEAKDAAYARFGNAFRFIPSDVPNQVEAIEATTRKLVDASNQRKHAPGEKPGKIMLICDITKRNGSDAYTRPICDSLRDEKNAKYSIASYIAGSKELDVDTGDIWGLVTEIRALMNTQPHKWIVFIGYPELARVLLEELRERARVTGDSMSSYTFIMSEACLTNDLLGFGASIYVTSPFNPARVLQCIPALKDTLRKINVIPSAEGYSFDAVFILSKAVAECKENSHLDRECVRQYLQKNGDNLVGHCERYHIGAGERRDAPYYVYSSCKGQLQLRWEIGTDHEDPYEKWPCRGNSE